MSVSSISSNLSSLYQTSQVGSTARAASDSQAGAVQGDQPPAPPKGGGFGQAVMQSLASALGVDTSSASAAASGASATNGSGDSTSGQDPQQALGNFMHSLMAALHAQGGGQAAASGQASSGGGDSDGDGGRVHGGHHGHGGGRGKMEADLQSLVQSLGGSTSTDTSGAGSSTSDGSNSDGSNSTTSDLQSSFKNLLSALGASTDNSGATLNTFLQNLESKMAGVQPTGNAVNTTA